MGNYESCWYGVRKRKSLRISKIRSFLIYNKKDESHLCRLVFLLESLIQDSVYKGDNHHKDPMTLFLFTSSRTDSIRTRQYLVFNLYLHISQRAFVKPKTIHISNLYLQCARVF